jgi:hypothetical protein
LSELSDAPIDHFYEYSRERNSDGFANLTMDELLEEIGKNSASGARKISNIIWRKAGGLLTHEFLLVQVCTPGRKDVWLRLERAAKHKFGFLRQLNPARFVGPFYPDDRVGVRNVKVLRELTLIPILMFTLRLGSLTRRTTSYLRPAQFSRA